MKDSEIRIGSLVWSYELDPSRKIWNVFSCVVVDKINGVFMHGYTEVKKGANAITVEIENSLLCKTEYEAKEKMLQAAVVIRDDAKQNILNHTRLIAGAWQTIDNCTELIDRLRKDGEA